MLNDGDKEKEQVRVTSKLFKEELGEKRKKIVFGSADGVRAEISFGVALGLVHVNLTHVWTA